MQILILFFILIASNITETVVGFAGTILALSMGAYFFDLKELIIILLPLNFLLNSIIFYKNRKNIDYKILLYSIVLPMFVGILISFPFQDMIESSILKRIFGYFIIFVSVIEMIKLKKPVKVNIHFAKLFSVIAGIIHGLLTTGGPLVVLSVNSLINEKRKMRNILSAVWSFMSVFMLVLYLINSKLTADSLKTSLLLLPSIPIGIYLGEKILNKITDYQFKIVILLILILIAINFIFNGK
jgi:uncharacterized membrane protein YfcA